MARPKSWIPRIADILRQLEADTTPEYTRQMVEKLFNLGADQAAQVMEVAGFSQRPAPGVGGLVSRTALLFYVKNCREGQDALQEIARREKLGRLLRAAEADLKFRNIHLRVTKDDEWSRFEELPGVSIKPGLLQVVFTPGDAVGLLDELFRFVKAAGNDWDSFQQMCAPALDASPDVTQEARG